MVICVDRDSDLHMAQLMPVPPTVSCFSKIQIGFTFLVPAHLSSPGQRAVKRVCVCVCVLFKAVKANKGIHTMECMCSVYLVAVIIFVHCFLFI